MNDPALADAAEPISSTGSARWLATLLGIVILALALRMPLVNSQSLTMDELYDLQTAHSGYAGILSAENRFPPLYHVLLHTWWKVFPADETGRGFSVLCGVLLVVWIARLGRGLAGPATGLSAAFLTSISPFAVWYSLEARCYSLYLLLATAALQQYVAALQTNRRVNWFGFGVASLLGVYTHYYFGLLLAVAGLVFLWQKHDDRAALKTGLIAFSLIAALCLPDLWFLREDLDQQWGFASESQFSLYGFAYTLFTFFSGYALGPSLRELHVLPGSQAAMQAAPWALALGAPVAVLFTFGVLRKEKTEPNLLLFVVVFGLAPILVVGLASRFSSFGFNPRHALWCFTPLMAVVAHGAAAGKPRWLAYSCGGLVAGLSLLSIWNHHLSDKYRHEDGRAVAEYLSVQQDQAPPVLVVSAYMYGTIAHYLPDDRQVVGLEVDPSDSEVKQLVLEETKKQLQGRDSFWFAYSRAFHGDPEGTILDAVQAAYEVSEPQVFAGFKLYEVRRKSVD